LTGPSEPSFVQELRIRSTPASKSMSPNRSPRHSPSRRPHRSRTSIASVRGNLVVAEATIPGVGRLDLRAALELTALIALCDRERGRRYAVRWLQRWLEGAESPTIEEAFAALGGYELKEDGHPSSKTSAS